MTALQQGEGSASAALLSHRLEQYKCTPISTPQAAQERRRQAALDERRRRRDASYSAARGLDGVGVGGLTLPELSDDDEEGAGEAKGGASKGSKSTKKKKSKANKAAESFANVLQQAELLDSLPEDLDDDWIALPWIPRGRRVLARVDWDPRYREDRLTLYSRRRGEPINPASSGQRAMTATVQEDAAHDGEAETPESSMAQDAPSSPSADLGLPTSFASGPSTTATTTTTTSSQAQQQQPKPRPRRRGGRSSHHHHPSYSFPLPLPLPRGTELDCVFSPRSAVLWVLDVRRWGHANSNAASVTDLRDHDAEFRLYWLSARLQEMEPPFLPAHFPANDVPPGEREVAGATTTMLDATGPFPYPFIIKALPAVPAPIGRTIEEWKRKVLDVATAGEPPRICTTAKVRRLITAEPPAAAPAEGEEGMDIDATAPPTATLVTVDALLFPPSSPQDATAASMPATPSSDGLLLYHREAGYVEGEEKTPLAAWVPTSAIEEGGMDLVRFKRLLEERDAARGDATWAKNGNDMT